MGGHGGGRSDDEEGSASEDEDAAAGLKMAAAAAGSPVSAAWADSAASWFGIHERSALDALLATSSAPILVLAAAALRLLDLDVGSDDTWSPPPAVPAVAALSTSSGPGKPSALSNRAPSRSRE
mmetsp:Transcript_8030/g.19899  ORF Transcript_8030/g.19899 Transcript_8030/m.19899 type:complete len:124 (-) Transcript_8030:5-376(-)